MFLQDHQLLHSYFHLSCLQVLESKMIGLSMQAKCMFSTPLHQQPKKISLPAIRAHLCPSRAAPGCESTACSAHQHRLSFAITASIRGAGQLCSCPALLHSLGHSQLSCHGKHRLPSHHVFSQAWPSQSRREEGPLPQKQFQINTFAKKRLPWISGDSLSPGLLCTKLPQGSSTQSSC